VIDCAGTRIVMFTIRFCLAPASASPSRFGHRPATWFDKTQRLVPRLGE
jgi:hypothetical protein